ncbi:helix-turn-helix domain-containing protein [Kocuria massiliensis]|uniref:helix-turn-helix domain-containing protein n=1 Tax=Kocuria massiliensis TaxID=1926282 RepID=UPI0022B977AB|nr:helix-turn-helix domain-containing protein [Kocuria massiliensis]
MIPARNPQDRLTAQEAAEYLNKSVQTLQGWRSDGEGPAYIKGRPIMYRVSELEEFLTSRTVYPTR